MMSTLFQDLRFGLRMLAKNPGFTAVAIMTLALGIGTNTAIFSVISRVLLRPLPYPSASRLVMVWQSNPRKGENQGRVSVANLLDWKTRDHLFEMLAGFVGPFHSEIAAAGRSEKIETSMVTPDFFTAIGVSPSVGRAFLPGEDDPARANVVVFSNGVWQELFGADPATVGKTVLLNGKSYLVVGVMPAGFKFPEGAQAWLPRPVSSQAKSNYRDIPYFKVIGRLKPRVPLSQAETEMNSIAQQLGREYPEANQSLTARLVPLYDQLVGDVRPALLLLWLSVAVVLLIACVNLANLMLARAKAREKEFATRAALGAGGSRIIRQLLSESVLLSLCGGTLGLLLAVWLAKSIPSLAPSAIPRLEGPVLNGEVLVFTLSACVLTAFAFGLLPAWQASRPDLIEAMKVGTYGTASASRTRFQQTLIALEVGMTFILLVGAGLMMRSLWRLWQVNPGFNPQHVVTLRLDFDKTPYADPNRIQQLFQRVASIPGVHSVGANSFVLKTELEKAPVAVEAHPWLSQDQRTDLPINVVAGAYFQTMQIPLLRGRLFESTDTATSMPVAVVNEAAAGRFWPNEDPIGKRFKFDEKDFKSPWYAVVGVVGSIHREGLDKPFPLEAYLPYSEDPEPGVDLVVRTEGDIKGVTANLRQAIQSLDKNLDIRDVRTMEEALDDFSAERRFNTLLVGIFAFSAVLLAAVGILGVVSYWVSRRTQEIGIRMALGATRADVLGLFLRQLLVPISAGIGSGVAVAVSAARLLRSFLFGMGPLDRLTFGTAILFVGTVGCLAGFVPARRATKVDPMVALRHE
jgi:putative ABC transport system permease protein